MAKIRNKVEIATKYGKSSFITFTDIEEDKEHFAIVFKNADNHKFPIVRVHSECITGDLFGSFKCDCGDQLHEALKLFSKSGGILLYLRQEGRGIGLYNKLDAYALQEKGFDTFQANTQLNFPDDMRSFKVAADMLIALDVKNIKLLSNNPDKYQQIQHYGIHIKEQISTGLFIKNENKKYLQSKVEKAGHFFHHNLLNLQAR